MLSVYFVRGRGFLLHSPPGIFPVARHLEEVNRVPTKSPAVLNYLCTYLAVCCQPPNVERQHRQQCPPEAWQRTLHRGCYGAFGPTLIDCACSGHAWEGSRGSVQCRGQISPCSTALYSRLSSCSRTLSIWSTVMHLLIAVDHHFGPYKLQYSSRMY